MEPTFFDVLDMRRLGDSANEFETVNKPERMGNPAPIAYGGWTLAVAIQAAFHTLETPQDKSQRKAIFSVLGSYLGPAGIDRPLRASVVRIRDTRTFTTRHVTVSQIQADGKASRPCLFAAIDFVASPNDVDDGSASLLRYSPPFHRSTPEPPSRLPDYDDYLDSLVKSKKLHPKMVQGYRTVFALWRRFFHSRHQTDSVLGPTAMGLSAASVDTPQDSLPITDKSSPSWSRSRVEISGEAIASRKPPEGTLPFTPASVNAALIAFALDGALSFIPLTHSHLDFSASSAASSLDFALRYHHDRPDFSKWHLHELRTIAGGWQRTFSEGRLLTEKGELIASMSQQSVLRPAKGASKM